MVHTGALFLRETEEGNCSHLVLGAHGACPTPLAGPSEPSSRTDSTRLLPQNKKAKERGFFTSCLATQGGKKQSETWKQLWGGPASTEPALPCGEPAEPPGPTLQKLRLLGKRGTGRAWRVEQPGAQIGAGQPQPEDAAAAWRWHRKRPQPGAGRPLWARRAPWGPTCCFKGPARGPGAVVHARWAPISKPEG